MKKRSIFTKGIAAMLILSSFIILSVGGVFFAQGDPTPEQIGKALAYQITFNSDLSAAPSVVTDFRSINGYGAFSSIVVRTGDKLSYDVYIPADGNYKYGMGAMDGQYSPSWGLIRATASNDQNNNSLYSDLSASYGINKWITRTVTLTASAQNIAHIGPGTILTKADAQALASKTTTVYYRNIKIIHTDTSVSPVYVDGGFSSNDKMESNIDSALGTVSLKEVTITDSSVTSSAGSSSVSSQPTAPEAVGRALAYQIAFNSNLSAATEPIFDVRSINGYNAFSSIILNTGDKLVYDVYIPSDGNYKAGMGGIDGQVSPSWALLRANNPKDQNNNALYTDLSTAYGTNKWVTREIAVTATGQAIAHIGPGAILTKADTLTLAGKTATIYYRNIKVVHANSTVNNIYVNGGFTANTKMEGNIDGALGAISLSEVNTGDTSSSSTLSGTSDITVPSEKSLMYKINWKSAMAVPKDPMFVWHTINGQGAYADSIKVKKGDILSYDVFIPSTGNYIPGIGALDFQTSVSWNVFRYTDGSPADTNGNALYTDLKTAYGTNKWITRTFKISDKIADGNGLNYIGPSLLIGSGNYADIIALAGKTTIVYFNNIKLKHADGSVSVVYGSSTAFKSGTVVETKLTDYATIELTQINGGIGNANTGDTSGGILLIVILFGATCASLMLLSKKTKLEQ